VIVLGCQTVSQLAAIYAGATFAPEVARTTTLLSPLINGVATIVLSLLVDPTCNILVDQAKAKERPEEDIETMSFTLAAGAVVGTLLSQLLFIPAAMLISAGAQFLDTFI
jgi:chromate transport protein ChrA